MAYTKLEWQSGDTALSANNMNHIEDGIEEALIGVNALNNKIGILSITGPFNTSDATGIVFDIPNNYRGIVTIHDSSESKNGIYMVYATGSGAVGYKTISEASDIVVVTNYINRFRLNPGQGTRTVMMINISGIATKIDSQ